MTVDIPKNMVKEFKPSVIEALQYYVYCLVDPRDNRIFYVGKGKETEYSNMRKIPLTKMTILLNSIL